VEAIARVVKVADKRNSFNFLISTLLSDPCHRLHAHYRYGVLREIPRGRETASFEQSEPGTWEVFTPDPVDVDRVRR
jgi:hypothetical protein